MQNDQPDYKATLNLPDTAFPMKANLSQREPEILNKWRASHLYQKLREQNKGRQSFIVLDGPPYANGHIHVGHAVNKILKDMVVKSKTMSGFDVPFVPCWDCHGLPIELNVEKKHGKVGKTLSATEFRTACRHYAQSQMEKQRDDFIRLGILGDWDHPCLTMDPQYEADIIRSLSKIIERHHLYQGYKPVYWCLDCASALAEAEVEYQDKTSLSVDVRFQVVDALDVWRRFKVSGETATISIPIWTTTPWSLPGNQAVALHPTTKYVLIAHADEQLIVAEALLPVILKRYQIEVPHIVGHVMGVALVGAMLHHPLFDKTVPVINGEHVTVDAGTGAVHIAPAHGPDDFLLGKQYHLTLDNPVWDNGCYRSDVPLFAGLFVSKVEPQIIETLIAHKKLLHQSTISHSYPHCWRHKTPVIYRATPQWFISMDQNKLRADALSAISHAKWVPSWGEARIQAMVQGRPDWCLSRQRTWGVPFALFVHKETGELHPNTTALMEKVALLVEKEGIEAWFSLDNHTLLGEEADQYNKTQDVLDVWFDSGVLHTCVLKAHPELQFPADLYLEGSDQHRGWFQSSLLTSIAMYECAPYQTVLTHGFTVDGKGHKMSKSLGNVIAPDEVIRSHGADILRLWVASSDYRGELAISKEILTRSAETYRRIRNTIRFFLANLHDFDPAKHLVLPDAMLSIDQWAVDTVRIVQQDILNAYDAYQFHLIIQKLHHFCVVEMGGFYLDIIKDRQYTMPKESLGRRSAQTALYHIVHAFVRWMAPIMSFTAEEIVTYLKGFDHSSIFLSTWYSELAPLPSDAYLNQAHWKTLRVVRDAVNKEMENQRQQGILGSPLEAAVTLYCDTALYEILQRLKNELRFMLITSSAIVLSSESRPADVIVTDVPGLLLQLSPIQHVKCDRCWHRVGDVNADPAYPGLCGRCIVNVGGVGEERHYV